MITAILLTCWLLAVVAGVVDNCIRNTLWVFAVLGVGGFAAALALIWSTPWPV